MFGWSGKFTLQAKAIAVIMLIIVMTMAAVGLITVVQTNRLIATGQLQIASSMASSLAHSCELAMYVDDRDELLRLVNRFASQPNVVFVSTYDAVGNPMVTVTRDKSRSDQVKLFMPYTGTDLVVVKQGIYAAEIDGETLEPDALPQESSGEGGDTLLSSGRSVQNSTAVAEAGGDGQATHQTSAVDASGDNQSHGDDGDLKSKRAPSTGLSDATEEEAAGHGSNGRLLGWVLVGLSVTEVREAQASQAGLTLIVFVGVTLAALAVVVAVVGSWGRRLVRLIEASNRISTGDLDWTVHDGRNDEIGHLANSFEEMRLSIVDKQNVELRQFNEKLRERQAELEREMHQRHEIEEERTQLQKELLESTHKAGMAEVATGVLHNVGNVLNSINISANELSGMIDGMGTDQVARVTQLLVDHKEDLETFVVSDQRAQMLPGYYEGVVKHLRELQVEMRRESQSLAKNIDHVKQVVAMQQMFAKAGGALEPLDLTDLMDDAIKVNEAALDRHQIELEAKYDHVPAILLDRHKVMQIFINVISNAKYAMGDTEPEKRKLDATDKSRSPYIAIPPVVVFDLASVPYVVG